MQSCDHKLSSSFLGRNVTRPYNVVYAQSYYKPCIIRHGCGSLSFFLPFTCFARIPCGKALCFHYLLVNKIFFIIVVKKFMLILSNCSEYFKIPYVKGSSSFLIYSIFETFYYQSLYIVD